MDFSSLGLGNLTVSDSDWEATPQSVRNLLGALVQKIVALQEQTLVLQAKIETLEEKLNTNSRNSGRPASSDPSGGLPSRGKSNPENKKQGGQPGHPGNSRPAFAATEVDKIVDQNPSHCSGCGYCLADIEPSNYLPHQVTELPEKLMFVIEYRLHSKICRCGEVNKGELPDGVSQRKFGPRLMSAVAMLSGTYHMSRRDIVDFLCKVLDIEMSLGSVSSIEGLVTTTLESARGDLEEAIQNEDCLNMDDTGWRKNNKYACLWVATSPNLTLFKITPDKKADTAKAILGRFQGILTSDRAKNLDFFSGYRQTCWAHLDRHFKRISERKGLSAQVGLDAMKINDNVFVIWRQFLAGQLDHEGLLDALQPERDRLHAILTRGATCKNPKTENTCQNILDMFTNLWTFAYLEGVEPTNNAAERQLRDGVMWRKTCYGSQSDRGNRFAESMLSVNATCRQQGVSIRKFLEQTILAFFKGIPGPTLRPAPA